MKRIVTAVFVIFAIVGCSSCATEINIRFVNQEGEDITFFEQALPSGQHSDKEKNDTSFPTSETAVSESTDDEISSSMEPFPIHTETDAEDSTVPSLSSKEEILAFYRNAVKRVRSGEAGYHKKEWQSVQISNMTGIAAVDSFINTELSKRATSEADADTVAYEKGTQNAINYFPDCILTDVNQISSATCKEQNGIITVSIVMRDEDTPESIQQSMLGQITDIILFRNEIERNLKETLSAVKNYEYSIVYKGFEVICELTEDGRMVSLQHHAYAEVHISTAQVLFFTFRNKDAVLLMDAVFSDFIY